jgi:hypothetical protein
LACLTQEVVHFLAREDGPGNVIHERNPHGEAPAALVFSSLRFSPKLVFGTLW